MYIKKVVILLFIMSLIVTSFIANNDYHLENCDEEDCHICALIKIAKIVISTLVVIVIVKECGFCIYYILSRIKRSSLLFLNKSLVFQKVQLND